MTKKNLIIRISFMKIYPVCHEWLHKSRHVNRVDSPFIAFIWAFSPPLQLIGTSAFSSVASLCSLCSESRVFRSYPGSPCPATYQLYAVGSFSSQTTGLAEPYLEISNKVSNKRTLRSKQRVVPNLLFRVLTWTMQWLNTLTKKYHKKWMTNEARLSFSLSRGNALIGGRKPSFSYRKRVSKGSETPFWGTTSSWPFLLTRV